MFKDYKIKLSRSQPPVGEVSVIFKISGVISVFVKNLRGDKCNLPFHEIFFNYPQQKCEPLFTPTIMKLSYTPRSHIVSTYFEF